jgi:hypothetical protein
MYKLTNTQFKLIIDDIGDLDTLMEFEVNPDLTYADADPEMGTLPPE